MQKRYHFIDCVKGIAILGVVAGHLFSVISEDDPMINLSGVIRFMSSYELAAFFVVSGFLMGEREDGQLGFRGYFARRVKKCMTVYIVMSLLYLLGDMSWGNFLYTVTGFGIGVLWFLPALVLSEALHLLIRKIGALWVQAGISAALAAVAFVCGRMLPYKGESASVWFLTGECLFIVLLRALLGQLFVEIGMLLNLFIKKASNRLRIAGMAVCLIVGIAGSLQIRTADWRIMNMTEPLIWLIAAIAMCVGLMLFFYVLEPFRFRLLEEIGKESLLIMCTHMYFGIMPQSIALGYRFSAVCAHAKNYVFWGTVICSMTALETLFVLIKRYGYKY